MKCHWTRTAQKELEKVVIYITDNFGVTPALRFIERIEQWDAWISENPEMARIEPLLVSKKKRIYRSIVIQPYSKLIIYTDSKGTHIAAIWDMRQSPKTLIKKLR